jgi:predicted glycoside hydrolase/deacetylase ChbG (UPF0249 family)
VIERLGFSAQDRVVVVHVDDIGMCSAANLGALRALEGSATCGSVMVPCPAFEEIARIAVERPEIDLGVHLTLNAEHETLRWGPVRDDVPGLLSPDRGMWRTARETVESASVAEVKRELRAQIDRALESGIDVTHLDSHMGTLVDVKFVEVYLQLARDYRLPIFVPRVRRETLVVRGLGDHLERYLKLVEALEAEGFPIFDHFSQDSLHFKPGTGPEHNCRRLEEFGPGLAYLITHCAAGDAELAAITADWRQRDEEHRIYSDGRMAQIFEEQQIRTIGMRPLRDLLRANDA